MIILVNLHYLWTRNSNCI